MSSLTAYYIQKTREEIREKQTYLGDGKAASWNHYLQISSEITAMKKSIERIIDCHREYYGHALDGEEEDA